MHLASQQSALVKELVDSGDIYQPLAWTPHEAYRFLKDVPAFEESGLLVRLPDWWKKRPRPRVGVTIGDTKQKKFDAKAMLDFKVQLALGDEELTEAEWRELMAADDGLVLLRGQWVEVDRQKLQEALDHWKQVQKQAEGGLVVHRRDAAVGGRACRSDRRGRPTARIANGRSSTRASGSARFLPRCEARRISFSDIRAMHLKATLRKYQETGVEWLRFLSGLGLGACLADDMGLGKTVQVLALLLALKDQKDAKPSLLVLPASLLANWKAEMARFTPTLRALFVHPAETPKEELDRVAADPSRALRDTDLVVTTYGMLLRQPWLLKIHWQLAVLDEAQAIKNPGCPADEDRQAAPGRRTDRTDRHARGKPACRTSGRCSISSARACWGRRPSSRSSSSGWASVRRTAMRRCGAWCSRTSCGG